MSTLLDTDEGVEINIPRPPRHPFVALPVKVTSAPIRPSSVYRFCDATPKIAFLYFVEIGLGRFLPGATSLVRLYSKSLTPEHGDHGDLDSDKCSFNLLSEPEGATPVLRRRAQSGRPEPVRISSQRSRRFRTKRGRGKHARLSSSQNIWDFRP